MWYPDEGGPGGNRLSSIATRGTPPALPILKFEGASCDERGPWCDRALVAPAPRGVKHNSYRTRPQKICIFIQYLAVGGWKADEARPWMPFQTLVGGPMHYHTVKQSVRPLSPPCHQIGSVDLMIPLSLVRARTAGPTQ